MVERKWTLKSGNLFRVYLFQIAWKPCRPLLVTIKFINFKVYYVLWGLEATVGIYYSILS